MDYIYIDASIIEGDNFTEGKRINQILKLSEDEHIRIVLTAITYNEIINSATRIVKDSVSKFKKYRSETRVLRNIPVLKSEFDNIDEQKCIDDFKQEFDTRLAQSKAVIIDYPTVNIKDVFEKYFKDEFPFSQGRKKNEFPDAFALISVENWCKENGCKCFVFSHDKDLLNYQSDELVIVRSYEEYLDRKLREVEAQKQRKERLDRVTELYETEKEFLEKEISQWLYGELENTRTFYEYFQVDVHMIDIKDYFTDLSDFQIISIDDHEILLEASADIGYDVDVEIDDENASMYDSEDKMMYYYDSVVKSLSDSQTIKVLIKVTLALVDKDIMGIDIEQINNGQNLTI